MPCLPSRSRSHSHSHFTIIAPAMIPAAQLLTLIVLHFVSESTVHCKSGLLQLSPSWTIYLLHEFLVITFVCLEDLPPCCHLPAQYVSSPKRPNCSRSGPHSIVPSSTSGILVKNHAFTIDPLNRFNRQEGNKCSPRSYIPL